MTRMVLLYAEGVSWMATMQLTYAMASATNLVYFGYIYMVVEAGSYQVWPLLHDVCALQFVRILPRRPPLGLEQAFTLVFILWPLSGAF